MRKIQTSVLYYSDTLYSFLPITNTVLSAHYWCVVQCVDNGGPDSY